MLVRIARNVVLADYFYSQENKFYFRNLLLFIQQASSKTTLIIL
jgi:hypothetical protein